MTRRTCEEYNPKKNGKEDSEEDEVRRRKKTFQKSEVLEENAPEENRNFRPLVLLHFHSAADKRSSFPLLCG